MNVAKQSDDIVDSGIEESSTTSEAQKGSASKATTFGVEIKQERQTSDDSSDDSYTAPPPTTRSKRKLSFGNDSVTSSQAKRIKTEPVESESSKPSKSSQSKPSGAKKDFSSQSSEKPSGKDKEKKAKKRKSVFIDDADDFETSLQKLLSSTQIKKEK